MAIGGQPGNDNAKNESDKMSSSFKARREVKDGTAGRIGKQYGVSNKTLLRLAEIFKTLSPLSTTRTGKVGVAPVVTIPLWCGVTEAGLSVTKAGLSVTKAGLHTYILHYATRKDSKDKTISCVTMHK